MLNVYSWINKNLSFFVFFLLLSSSNSIKAETPHNNYAPPMLFVQAYLTPEGTIQVLSISMHLQQMSRWSETFNQQFNTKIAESTNEFLKSTFTQLQAQPNIQNLVQFRDELQKAVSLSNSLFDTSKLSQVNALIQHVENYEKISQVPFGDKTALKGVENQNIENENQKKFYDDISKYSQIPESKFRFSTPLSSPLGQKLYTLQKDIVSSASASDVDPLLLPQLKTHSQQLWLADLYAQRGDHVRAQLLINDIYNEHFSPGELNYHSDYLNNSFSEYTKNHLLYNNDFKKKTEDIVEKNIDDIRKGNYSFLDQVSDQEISNLFSPNFTTPLSPEIISAFKESYKNNIQDVAFQKELQKSANELGFLGSEKTSITKLTKYKSYQGATTDTELAYLSSNLKEAQGLFKNKIQTAQIPLTQRSEALRTLEVSSELRSYGDAALSDGDLGSSSFYLEASRQSALISMAQATARMGIGFIPFVGDAVDISEALTGIDIMTGEKLSNAERVYALMGVAIGSRLVWGQVAKYGSSFIKGSAHLVTEGTAYILKQGAKTLSKVGLVQHNAAIIARESEKLLAVMPKQADAIQSLVKDAFENTLQKLYKVDSSTYFKELGVAEDVAKQRMKVATDFYSSHPGFIKNGAIDHAEIGKHFAGIDFAKPIEILEVKKGSRFVAWHADAEALHSAKPSEILSKAEEKILEKVIEDNPSAFRAGNYYTTIGNSPQSIGIANTAFFEIPQKGLVGVAKTPHVYELTEDLYALKSRSSAVVDSWTYKNLSNDAKEIFKVPNFFNPSEAAYNEALNGVDFATGGGEQFFMNGYKLKEIK